MKVRKNASDKEFENWMINGFFENGKGATTTARFCSRGQITMARKGDIRRIGDNTEGITVGPCVVYSGNT